MNAMEFGKEWDRLRSVFDKLPAVGNAREWFRVVKDFSAEDLSVAVDEQIEHGRFAPKPADLRAKCWKARDHREQAQLRKSIENGRACPFCGGRGYVLVVNPWGDGRDADLPCGACDANRHYPHEQRVTEFRRAINDPGWKWDKARKELRRRTEWIGDEAPARMDEEFDFWGAVKGIGGAL